MAVTHHGPCESCGSSDACAHYDDGHTFCFSCRKHSGGQPKRMARSTTSERSIITDLEFVALTKRGLTEETCRKWRYGISPDGSEQVAQFFDKDGELVAQKTRNKDKDFCWIGKSKKAGLFGQHLWAPGGKTLVITEGEIDAMSVSQIQDHKWPVVSVPNGAAGAAKSIAASLEYVNSFDKVVFMFDSDEPGRKAASECAMLLTPGKAFIAELPLKDANEMLVAGQSGGVVQAFWNAKPYRPDGVVAGSEVWDKVIDFRNYDSISYPWQGLEKITRGARKGELVLVAAGTGVGKSEVVRQVAHHFHTTHGEVIGYLALEESVQRTALGFMGLHMGKRLYLDPRGEDLKVLKEAFDATVGQRYFLYDHFGSLDGDRLCSQIRYMVRGLGCRTVVLDHISIVVSGSEIDDERKALDVITTTLKSLTMELEFRLIVIAHLKRVDGVSHEEGGRVKLTDIRGTGALAQLSNIVIGLERNQQSEAKKNLTCVRVLKNRHTGETGVACYLKFDLESGRLIEVAEPVEEAEGGDF